MTAPFLIIGLGNPGKKYAGNRHNVGFMAIDKLADSYRFSAASTKFGGLIAEGKIDEHKTFLFKPLGYMNLSGEPARQIAQFYKIPLEHIIVLHDELDLPLAKIRVKTGGGHGGHNGLKSLDAHLGKDYRRVRIGIDHPGDKELVSPYVLSDFSKEEKNIISRLLEDISTHMPLLLSGDEAGFMNKLSPPPLS